ncbi:DUF4097 family beta strand repeat-containing protein [Poritiphilus flavus]|uniref:Adhesin domain-containing protein n=1 Tax=Poritiphilus flavus TaxID=2697053 RepID=A0A6L9E7K3_9FLAO|nr:hypothetical protein [Poritiphilus flavus]NAS10765.1 hypothetical protein [Poritiphilus flavus]
MKQLIIALLALATTLPLTAQRIIEKSLDYKNQVVELEVKFASEIEVKTWDKQSVYFKADLTTEDGKYLDQYVLDIREDDLRIEIASNAKPLFKKFQQEREKLNPGKKDYCCYDFDYEFNYTLYVPKNARFSVNSINGNLKAELIEGDFTADLINGDIEIQQYSGDLDLSTINGAIDLKMRNTTMTAETIHGNIYADEKLELVSTERHVGQKVRGSFDNADSSLRLNTINGNMYLRL